MKKTCLLSIIKIHSLRIFFKNINKYGEGCPFHDVSSRTCALTLEKCNVIHFNKNIKMDTVRKTRKEIEIVKKMKLLIVCRQDLERKFSSSMSSIVGKQTRYGKNCGVCKKGVCKIDNKECELFYFQKVIV